MQYFLLIMENFSLIFWIIYIKKDNMTINALENGDIFCDNH